MAASLSRFDLTRDAVGSLLASWGEPSYRAQQVWSAIYERGDEPGEITSLPQRLRVLLAEAPEFRPALQISREQHSDDDDTVKWLWDLPDGAQVETVLMHYPDRATVCISTQAGCAMGCTFCSTGQAGFSRQLSVGEVVEQVIRARTMAATAGRRLSNVVFMGMGEPLANYDATWGAVERCNHELGLSARHLTISTVGIVPGIRRLANEALPVNLAVSLHAANDALRNTIVPINRTYPLDRLAAACTEYRLAKGRRLSFEWALIDGVNDRRCDAAELADYARTQHAHVNLIPLNPTPGFLTRGTPPAGVRTFRDELARLGVNVTVRRNRGTGIDAACGQLRAAASS